VSADVIYSDTVNMAIRQEIYLQTTLFQTKTNFPNKVQFFL